MMQDVTYHIGILLVSLHIPSSQSLKDKRMVLKSIKDRVRVKFNVSVAELDTEDKWQTAVLGFSAIGNDQRYIDGCLQNILSLIESVDGAQISEQHIEFL